jgi:hypothetical protein
MSNYQPKTAEENYVYNTKRPIPNGKEVGFKDGDPKNIKFANLKLVNKKEEVKKEEPKKEVKKEEPKKKFKK